MKIFYVLKTSAFVLLLFGCASFSTPQSATNQPISQIVKLGGEGGFSVDPLGQKLSYFSNELLLLDLISGEPQKLANHEPIAINWNRDGSKLATFFPTDNNLTKVRLFSSEGSLLRDFDLPISYIQHKWSVRGDLLIVGFSEKKYTFGSNLQQKIFILDEENLAEILLSDTTLKPLTAKMMLGFMENFLAVAFSFLGDEVYFMQLHDPPEFDPYLVLSSMHWGSGSIRTHLRIPLQKVSLFASPNQDAVNLETSNFSQKVSIWPNKNHNQPSTNYFFRDGQLFLNGQRMKSWGLNARFQILDDGRYYLGTKGVLYEGKGLTPQKTANYSEKVWSLRRWRAMGLISPDEYLRLLDEGKG